MPKHITPPRLDDPLISHKSQQDTNYMQKAQQEHPYMVCNQQAYTWLLKIKQVGSTTYTNSYNETKPTHAKGRVTFNV
jgi:hypothetical protein